MALHRLGDTSYRNFDFDKDLWKDIDIQNLDDLLPEFYPPVVQKTSLSENRDLRWFFGKVQIEGKGKVQVIYPYNEEHSDSFRLKNVSFSTFPFIELKALAEQGWKCVGWEDSCTGIRISAGEDLTISEYDFESVTGFRAIFREDASNVGI